MLPQFNVRPNDQEVKDLKKTWQVHKKYPPCRDQCCKSKSGAALEGVHFGNMGHYKVLQYCASLLLRQLRRSLPAACQIVSCLYPNSPFGPERVSKPNKGALLLYSTTLNNQTSEACQPTDNDWWENLKLRWPDAPVLSGLSQFSVGRPESQQKLVGTLKCPSIHQTLSTVSCFPRLHSQHGLVVGRSLTKNYTERLNVA